MSLDIVLKNPQANYLKRGQTKREERLFENPQYRQFCLRYRHRFPQYVKEVHGYVPTWQQLPVMEAMCKRGFQVSVASGHGTGKTRLYASFVDYNLRVFPGSNTLLTSGNIDQLRNVVWKELDTIIAKVEERFPWMQGFFVKETKRYFAKGYKDSWFVIPKTAPKSNPENIAGMHRRRYVVLVDEASGVGDDILGVIRGGLTEEDNSFAMVSQGTRNTGLFYDSHHRLKTLFETFSLDSELSPLVSKKWIQEKLVEYGGFHAPEYQIKVKGAFPDKLSGMLIARSWAEFAAMNHSTQHGEEKGILIVSDVAGEGRNSSVILICEVSGHDETRKLTTLHLIEKVGNTDTMALAREIAFHYHSYPGSTVAVDAIGVGKGVCDKLEHELNVPVERMIWGKPSWYKERFRNQRAEGYYWLREGLFKENIHFPNNPKLFDQTANIPYEYDESSRFKLWPKERMRKHNIASPDLADCYAMAMLVDYQPQFSQNEASDTKQLDESFEALFGEKLDD